MIEAGTVITFLESTEAHLPTALLPDTSLIESGLLDSQALFQLSIWIEEQIGAPLDLETLEITKDWNTPEAIAHFVAHSRGQAV